MATVEIKGTYYYQQERKPVMYDRLTLVREPENRHDKNAISVWTVDSEGNPLEMLGHIPRPIAAILTEMSENQGLNYEASYIGARYMSITFPKETQNA